MGSWVANGARGRSSSSLLPRLRPACREWHPDLATSHFIIWSIILIVRFKSNKSLSLHLVALDHVAKAAIAQLAALLRPFPRGLLPLQPQPRHLLLQQLHLPPQQHRLTAATGVQTCVTWHGATKAGPWGGATWREGGGHRVWTRKFQHRVLVDDHGLGGAVRGRRFFRLY